VDKTACESVHHCDWPRVNESAIDQKLLDRMALALQIAALGRSARSASGIKLRQPLARARVYAGKQAVDLGELAAAVAEELNVKGLEFVEREGDLVEYEIGLLPQILGPKHGKRYPLLRQAVAAADASALARQFQAGLNASVALPDGGPGVELSPEEVQVRLHGREGYAVAEEKGIVVAVDVNLTPELEREGLARDLVRRIQTLRKDADLQLDDRIVTFYQGGDPIATVMEEWAGYVQAETLSVELQAGPVPDDADRQDSFKLAGHAVTLGIRRA